MPKEMKHSLGVAVALLALTFAVSTADASEATVSPAGTISAASSGNLTFTAGLMTIACPVTLNGRLAGGPIRTEGTGESLGSITEVHIGNESCTAGRIREVLHLPWNLSLISTLGTPPNEATGVSFEIREASFLLTGFFEMECLWGGNAAALMPYVSTRTVGLYTSSSIRVLEEHTIPTTTSGCASPGVFRGTFTLAPTQTITMR